MTSRYTYGRKSTKRIEDEIRNKNKVEKSNNEWHELMKMKKEDLIQTHHLHQLNHINLQNVLSCLVERYKAGYFYTYAGPMLLSMNPCLPTASRKSITDVGFASSPDSPSVYSIGEKCLKTLAISKMNSVVVVSGDSGAGKTTATEQLVSYFLCHNKQDGNGLDNKLREAALILESLGNASTNSNPNSSRFGRFIQLNYNDENIVGAEIKTCLLQKHRVSQSNCRNFHIFYYVLVGLIEDAVPESVALNSILSAAQLETILNMVPKEMIDSIQETDITELEAVLSSFKKLGMMDDFKKIVQVVTGIILLLNTQFLQQQASFGMGFEVDSKEALRIFSCLLSVTPDNLQQTLISRTIRTGGARRKSVFRKPCGSLTEVRSRIESMATTLYNSLFNYILNRLNSELKSPSPLIKKEMNAGSGDHNGNVTEDLGFTNRISLLDLYGFENLPPNHLEQLCINYANEKLQMTTNRIVKNNLGDLELTSIPSSLIQLEDEGRERIVAIQTEVFSLLNQVCILKREVSDSDIYEGLIQSTRDNKYIQTEKVMDRTGTCPFTIRHYATAVTYQMIGMVRKNNDTIPMEYEELFATSGDPFIRGLLKYNVQSEGTTVTTRRQQRTILENFKSQVDGLISALEAPNQEIYFIKCLRPNATLTRGQVNIETVKSQLVSAGIEDILKITSFGLPIRIPRNKFAEQFSSIHRQEGSELEKLFLKFGWDSSEAQCGTTKVLLSENAFKFLQNLEKFCRNRSASRIQRAWKCTFKIWQDERTKALKLLPKPQEELPIRISDGTPSRPRLVGSYPDEVSALMTDLNLRRGDGIVTRGQIHEGPIRFHVRRTPLAYSTNAKKSQGLNELLEK